MKSVCERARALQGRQLKAYERRWFEHDTLDFRLENWGVNQHGAMGCDYSGCLCARRATINLKAIYARTIRYWATSGWKNLSLRLYAYIMRLWLSSVVGDTFDIWHIFGAHRNDKVDAQQKRVHTRSIHGARITRATWYPSNISHLWVSCLVVPGNDSTHRFIRLRFFRTTHALDLRMLMMVAFNHRQSSVFHLVSLFLQPLIDLSGHINRFDLCVFDSDWWIAF